MEPSARNRTGAPRTALMVAAMIAVFPYVLPIPDFELPEDPPPPAISGIGTPIAEAPPDFGLARQYLSSGRVTYLDESSGEEMGRLFDYYEVAMVGLGWATEDDVRDLPEAASLVFSRAGGQALIEARRQNEVSWKIDIYICPPTPAPRCEA